MSRPTNRDESAGGATPSPLLNGLRVAVLVIFGLVYAYFLWQAIGNTILVPRVVAVQGFSLNGTGWVVLVLNILAAPLCFAAAAFLGARRSAGMLALLLTAGLCVLSALTLTLVAAPDFLNVIGDRLPG